MWQLDSALSMHNVVLSRREFEWPTLRITATEAHHLAAAFHFENSWPGFASTARTYIEYIRTYTNPERLALFSCVRQVIDFLIKYETITMQNAFDNGVTLKMLE